MRQIFSSNWFTRVSQPRRPGRPARRSAKPSIDALEDRVVPALYQVVPAGTENNVTTFATLQAALNVSTLADGDTIEIEAGSTPGVVGSNNTTEDNLTIQTDAAIPIFNRPAFFIDNAFSVAAGQTGLTLRNLNFTVTAFGQFTAAASVTFTGCQVTSGAANGIILSGAANILTGNQFEAVAGTALVTINGSGPGANAVSGNTFIGTNIAGGLGAALLSFDVPSATLSSDLVVDNIFIDKTSGLSGGFYDLISISDVNGLTIRDNVFQSPAGQSLSGVHTFGVAQNLRIQGNRFTIDLISSAGIVVNSPPPGATVGSSIVIDGNTFTSSAGTGIAILVDNSPTATSVTAQGNTFANCRTGILINTGTAPLSGIQLGAGANGLGGNIFRTFTAPATASSGAIVILGTSTGTISAQQNSFAPGVTPSTVVFPGTATVDVSNPLTGNAAFVAALYSQTLLRAGNLNSQSDAGGWVTALNNGLPRAIAGSGISHSVEALTKIVDKLYVQLLGRAPDADGQQGWVRFLRLGGSYAAAIRGFLESSEFKTKFGSPAGQISQMYVALLGRTASAGEVSGWEAVDASEGQGAVIRGLTGSAEFRGLGVRQFYGNFGTVGLNAIALPNLLHRGAAVTQSEIDGWVNNGFDLLTIEELFINAAEYFTNG